MAYGFLLATLAVLYVRPGDLNPALASWPFLSIAVAGAGLGVFLSWGTRSARPTWAPHLNWILGTWFGFVMSHVGHGYLAATISTFTGFFTNVVIVMAMVFILNSRSRLSGFATVWIYLTVFLAIGGVLQMMTGEGWGGQTLIKGRIQGIGIFSDPNDLALTFILAVPLAHARFRHSGVLGKFVFYGVSALLTYATFLTNSRGGVLSLLLVIFALSAHRFGKRLGTVMGTILVLALLVVGPSRMNEVDTKEASAQGRIAAWSEGIQMLKYNPIVGVGYGMFTDYHHLTAHNSFVLCFAENGLLGAFFWIGLLYVCFVGLRRVIRASRGDPPDPWFDRWGTDTRIALIGFLAGTFFLSRTYNVVLYVLVGFCAAVWRVASNERWEAEFKLGTGDRARVFGIVIAGIMGTYIMVKTFAVWSGNFY